MGDFTIKKGDTKPFLQVTLKDGDGTAINLTSAGAVFAMGSASGALVASGAATITGAATGEIEYQWGANDTANPGKFKGEFVVTYSDGKIETFPADNSLNVIINEDYS